MSAYDTAYPSRASTQDIQVEVVRNANSPRFVKENYIKTITEKFPIGDNILQVSATDVDGVSSHKDCISAVTVSVFFLISRIHRIATFSRHFPFAVTQ